MRKHHIVTYCSFFLSFLLVQKVPLFGQQPTYPPTIEKKIKQVETNLDIWVHLEGARNQYTLQERMAWHRVHGVSIAVIENYTLQWARG